MSQCSHIKFVFIKDTILAERSIRIFYAKQCSLLSCASQCPFSSHLWLLEKELFQTPATESCCRGNENCTDKKYNYKWKTAVIALWHRKRRMTSKKSLSWRHGNSSSSLSGIWKERVTEIWFQAGTEALCWLCWILLSPPVLGYHMDRSKTAYRLASERMKSKTSWS